MSTATLERPQLTYGEMRTVEQKVYDEEVMERVKAGMALLERKYGPEWIDKIDLETLNIADITQCVLGQVYGGFGQGLGQIRVSPYRYGFDKISESDSYAPLQAAWKDAIRSRVAQ